MERRNLGYGCVNNEGDLMIGELTLVSCDRGIYEGLDGDYYFNRDITFVIEKEDSDDNQYDSWVLTKSLRGGPRKYFNNESAIDIEWWIKKSTANPLQLREVS